MADITDPAWFYSSLAQVSASIFGVIGAVFATRLTDYVREARTAFDEIQRQVSTLRGNLVAAAKPLIDKTILNNQGVPAQDRARLAAAAALYETLIGRIAIKDLREHLSKIGQLHSSLEGAWQQHELEKHLSWLNIVAHRIDEFRVMARPGSLWAVWALLGWLSLVGIIWPMLALPGLGGTYFLSKPMILILFSVGALAFVGFLLRELILLWRLTASFEWR